MTERLSLDDKINGLAKYYEQLVALDPDLNKDLGVPFYSSGINVARGLRDARQSLRFSVECHARVEYGWNGAGLANEDLRSDTPERRLERAGILAMVTAPSSPEVFFDRAAQINEFLDRVVVGDEITVAPHSHDGRVINVGQRAVADTGRELYAIFPNGHISGRDLGIYYDRPSDWDDVSQQHSESVVTVILPTMFDGVVTYNPAQAA